MATQHKTSYLRQKLFITSLIAGLLLGVAHSAIWVNRHVFDTQAFTATAVESITSESSRDAIGARITNEALKDRPVLRNVAGDRVTNLLSGLLGTEQMNKLLTASVSRLHIYVTSNEQQDIDIDLTGIKSTISRLVEISGADQTDRINPDNIPDRIVLIEEENVPSFYSYGVALSWIAPVAFVIALVLLALPYLSDRKHYLHIMTIQGAMVALIGLLSLLVGPLFRPPVLEPFRTAEGRAVAGNLYDAFIQTYNAQTWALIGFGLLVCLAAGLINLWPRLKTLKS